MGATMKKQPSKRFRRTLPVLVIVGTVVAAFGVWCGASYLRLERMQVAIDESRGQLLAAERRRGDLSRNLIRGTDGLACLTENDRARLLSAVAALEQSMLRAESLSADPASYRRFREARSRLERGLQATWPELGTSGEPTAGWLLESLKPSIEAAALDSATRLDRFDQALLVFQRERGRFPGSFVTAIGRADAIERGSLARAREMLR